MSVDLDEITLAIEECSRQIEALHDAGDDEQVVELKDSRDALQAALQQLQNTSSSKPDAVIGPQLPPGARVARQHGNNARMHPRNRYAFAEPDFEALAQNHPELVQYLVDPPALASSRREKRRRDEGDLGGPLAAGPRVIDFTNANAARVLTQVLLRVDFGLDWWIPEGQLIPPLPNRANYIHWLEDLLALSSPEGMQHAAGLDIGCGTNLIYPLLGCAMHDNWRFVAVDVTPEALHWARRNADANEDLLQGRIVVRESGAPPALGKRHESILPAALHPGERFSFTMCNPPFFESMEQAGSNPRTAFAGTEAEMVWPGGDCGFVQHMVRESAALPRGTVHWYTSLVGRKDSLKKVRTQLYGMGVTALRTTEFFQGKTSRWAVAWSWDVPVKLSTVPLQSR